MHGQLALISHMSGNNCHGVRCHSIEMLNWERQCVVA